MTMMNIAIVEIGDKDAVGVTEIIECLQEKFAVDRYWYEEDISPEELDWEVADLQQNYWKVIRLG